MNLVATLCKNAADQDIGKKGASGRALCDTSSTCFARSHVAERLQLTAAEKFSVYAFSTSMV
jgi:hypothetical protein